jgi:hypothetical protein
MSTLIPNKQRFEATRPSQRKGGREGEREKRESISYAASTLRQIETKVEIEKQKQSKASNAPKPNPFATNFQSSPVQSHPIQSLSEIPEVLSSHLISSPFPFPFPFPPFLGGRS